MNNWKDSVFLLSYIKTKDKDGISIEEAIKSQEIPANFINVTRQEEQHSKIMGYTASLVVEIMLCNYDNQEYLIDPSTNKKYLIKRSYSVSSEVIQLTCSDISKKHG